LKELKPVKPGSVRAVAVCEAAKGVVVLLAGLGALSYANEEVRDTLDHLVGVLYRDLPRRLPHSIADAFANPSDTTLAKIAAAAALYAAVRFTEAFGLWRSRRWAEWFGLASGAVYLPFEILLLATKPSTLSAGILAVNLTVVWILYRALRSRTAVKP
jgi:uncharacterized membrane protein (DUF2068 family)